MSSSDVLYSARFGLVELIERGRTNTLRCPVYRAGVLVAPTSSTVAVYDQGGAVVLPATAAPNVGGIPSYDLLSAVVAPFSYGEGWRVEWRVSMPDGTIRTFDVEAMLVRRALFPVVTEADLYRQQSALDPAGSACIHSESDFADKLDEAWIQIQGRLLQQGNRPNLILSPQALRDSHLYLTLALIYEDFSTRLNATYAGIAAQYRAHFDDSFARLRYVYDDSDDNGQVAGNKRRGPSVSTLWLSSRGRSWH